MGCGEGDTFLCEEKVMNEEDGENWCYLSFD